MLALQKWNNRNFENFLNKIYDIIFDHYIDLITSFLIRIVRDEIKKNKFIGGKKEKRNYEVKNIVKFYKKWFEKRDVLSFQKTLELRKKAFKMAVFF